ncbi:Tfp pilus assembly protein, major pilin PilA [Flavobacteriales bacterium ALC-1]|nr:Tfp pilus assembly protein, major pilin PilA [Flavobacteriales bacterium ALC-1]
MKKASISILVICLMSLTSCLEMIDKAAKNAADQNSESLSEKNYQTITVDTLYRLDVPNYMKEMKSLHPEASLEYANIYKEAYSVVIHENKQEFISVFTELEEYDADLSPIENYTIVQKKMFKETIDDFKFRDYGLIDINGYPAKQIKMSGNIDGIDFRYVVAFVEGQKNIYMIMNWTDSSRINKLENTFEYINGTFKLI